MIDIDAYFARIGHAGSREPTLETLREIHRLHPQAIVFENLNPLMRWPVKLDEASIQQKLLRGGRGGYCYEHNLLLMNVLKTLGFEVRGLAARVIRNGEEDEITPRGHMLMSVTVESQPYLVDVGFGGATLTGPIRLEPGLEQPTAHEPYRLTKTNGHFMLQQKVRYVWVSLYRFDLQEQFLPDYEMANWYMSSHPDSHFLYTLAVARTGPGRRHTLRNNSLAVHHVQGQTERHTLTTAAELRDALVDIFELQLPDAPELNPILQRIAATPL